LPIPELLPNGILPEGIHECTLEEITARFGRFQATDRRPSLNQGLIRYLDELRQADIGKCLIVNGSFVTQADRPSDIDALLILKDDGDLSGDVPPFKYNAMSRRYIQNHHGLDIHFGFEGNPSAAEIIQLFQEVKGRPGLLKGILRINL
jgi:hypothetical protein